MFGQETLIIIIVMKEEISWRTAWTAGPPSLKYFFFFSVRSSQRIDGHDKPGETKPTLGYCFFLAWVQPAHMLPYAWNVHEKVVREQKNQPATRWKAVLGELGGSLQN